MSPDLYDYRGYYIVIITKPETYYYSTIKKILTDLWSLYIVNANVIVSNPEIRNDAILLTYFPFSRNHCYKVHPILWNYYLNGEPTIKKVAFPDKIQNMWGCPIIVVTFEVEPFMYVTKREDGTFYTDGIEGTLLRVLSQRMNFTSLIEIPSDGDMWGIILANGTKTGACKLLFEGKANLSLGTFGQAFDRLQVMDMSFSYYQTPLIFTVPPGRSYTSFEKLFKPFKYIIWSLLGVIFILGFFIMILLQRKFGNLFFTTSNHPYLNMMNIFFGGSVHNLPIKFMLRVIVLIWIMCALVLRNSYQGKLFTFLQLQKNYSSPFEIKRIVEENLTILITKSSLHFFDDLPELLGNIHFQNNLTLPFDEMDKPEFKYIYLRTKASIAYFNRIHSKSVTISDYSLFMFSIAIFTRKHSYLTHTIDNEILKYLANGIFDYWASKFVDTKYLIPQQIGKGPQKLTMNELSGGYQIFMLFLILSLFVFLLELLSTKIVLLKRFFDFIN